ncbi:hypothetical protein GQ53DRAFT_838981 [Thozetella sp. PMI_491]|nr:hypothetical protein GQ53DRAFT_838981 [Thozetella sp. PMI_491]
MGKNVLLDAELRCQLCRFRIEGGDIALVRRTGDEGTGEVPFLPENMAQWDHLAIYMHRRRERGLQVPCFHADCFNFSRRVFKADLTMDFVASMRYAFRASPNEDQRRIDRTRRFLASRLRDLDIKSAPADPPLLLRSLPGELLLLVATFLVRECAVVTARESRDPLADCDVDLFKNVYVQYELIDGVRYIRSLRNSDSTGGAGGQSDRLWSLQNRKLLDEKMQSDVVRTISFAWDHIGIRAIRFASRPDETNAKDKSTAVPADVIYHSCDDVETAGAAGSYTGPWWEHISRPSGIAQLRVKSDGTKIRGLEAAEVNTSNASWASITHPREIISLSTLRPRTGTRPIRMRYFDCNAPDTEGYSVATNGYIINAIYTHRQRKNGIPYRDTPRINDLWIYMPVDQNEYLTEICVQRAHYGSGVDVRNMMFVTNLGRCTLFGTPALHLPHRLQTVHTPPRRQTRIFYNVPDDISKAMVRYIAFHDPMPPTARPYPPSLVPVTPCPSTEVYEPWLFSRCTLKGVAGITLCKDLSLSHEPIIGMQLQYIDGARACVGQFRFDQALEKIAVDQKFYIRIQKTRDTWKSGYVSQVSAYPPSNNVEKESWIAMDPNGNLEWWFSRRSCLVRCT